MYYFKRALILSVLIVSGLFAQLENFTYKLTQSTSTYELWTTVPSERVFKDSSIPEETGSDIKLYMAKNEFEPLQIVIKPTSSENITISMGDFGSGITAELYQVKYVYITESTDNLGRTGDYPDPLWPIENGASVSITGSENTAFWINVFVPTATLAGDYNTNINFNGINIPVKLNVFNFAISDTLHIKSQMNLGFQTILQYYGVEGYTDDYWMYVNKTKQFFKDHRLTPKSPLWPGGLTSSGGAPLIDYDCEQHTLSDPYGIWGFEIPAQDYLDGNNLRNGIGFSSFMAMTFQNNDASVDQRPSSFCSISRSAGDWYTGDSPNSPYNQAWFAYLNASCDYLQNLDYLEKAYYYFANEPQDQDDYNAVTWYSRYLQEYVPDLKLMISEEPKPEILDHPDYISSGQIDVWLLLLHRYNSTVAEVSFDRGKNHGEESWIYFNHGTRPPFFNPITLDHPGIESKFTGWFLWKYRLKGIAYYSMNYWDINPWIYPMTNNHNGDRFMLYPPSEDNIPISYGSNNHRFVPSIRLELMRDSFEDYEYLYILNGNRKPEFDNASIADLQVNKIIEDLKSYVRHDQFMYNLRKIIGQKNANEITEIPDIYPSVSHPRAEGPPGNYYINFQDPAGSPANNPLIVNGKEYWKIGWEQYNSENGYGWYGDMANIQYHYSTSGPNELQNSIIFDDVGRTKVFEFDLPVGTYNVTVSVGWPDGTYPHNYIEIEGVIFINDEASNPYLVRTKEITVSRNSKLIMNMGIFDEYTMLNYMNIEAVTTSIDPDPDKGFPVTFKLSQNYPNPFNPTTTINFSIPKQTFVELTIMDILGKKIQTLVEKNVMPGVYNYKFDGSNLASGVYVYILKTKEFTKVKKMLLVK